MYFDRKTLLLALGWMLVIGWGYAWAQQEPDFVIQRRAHEAQQLKISANRWMLTPIDLRLQQDAATPAERQARDLYWDQKIGAGALGSGTAAPLSDPKAREPSITHVEPDPQVPELPSDLTQDVWVIGTFDTYHTFLSASQRSVYTEIDFAVQHVFGHPNAPGLKPGTTIAIGMPGGTIIAPWSGSAFSYFLHPHSYAFQPGHTYLVGLQYITAGNFYTTGSLQGQASRWDLTDGTVRPDSSIVAYRAKHGKPEISGLKASDAIQMLDRLFSQQYSRGH